MARLRAKREGPRRRPTAARNPIKFRGTNSQAQMIGRIFTGSIPLCGVSEHSLAALYQFGARGWPPSVVPHAHALHDFNQQSFFFRQLVELQRDLSS